jgi:iron complex transport system substrate-binding protein
MNRLVALALAAGTAVGAHAVQVKDDGGVTLSLERPAQRIVSLAPHLAEIAFAAGAGASLAGVSAFSHHPAEARKLPVVASHGRVDIERLIALRPDLVLAWQSGNSPLQIDRVRRLGVPVLVTEVRSLADIPRLVRLAGALAGSEALAETRARNLEDEIETLRRRYAGVRQLEVFLEIWHRPMLTVNGAHLISDALRVCGGRNVFAAARTLTPPVSREQVLNARPDAIVTGGFGSEVREAWRGLEPVPAVRSGRIYPIDPDLLHGQGPRVVQGVRALCERLDLARNR